MGRAVAAPYGRCTKVEVQNVPEVEASSRSQRVKSMKIAKFVI
jgi:hypothetical protein